METACLFPDCSDLNNHTEIILTTTLFGLLAQASYWLSPTSELNPFLLFYILPRGLWFVTSCFLGSYMASISFSRIYGVSSTLPTFLYLCLEFLPCSILPCHRTKDASLLVNSNKTFHSKEREIPHHFLDGLSQLLPWDCLLYVCTHIRVLKKLGDQSLIYVFTGEPVNFLLWMITLKKKLCVQRLTD